MENKLLLPNALMLGEVEELLAGGQSVWLKATGNSMLPFIAGGRDSVLIGRVAEEEPLRVGQIVLARLQEGRYVLHRIIRIDGKELVLMGDGNLKEKERCRRCDVKGVVQEIVRNGRRTDCNARRECDKAKVWRALLPIRRYLLYIYRYLWKR